MANTLDENYWAKLLPRIQAGRCTPLIGSDINHGILPSGSEIAQELAEKHRYPFRDRFDLARVTQFLAATRDPIFAKEEVRDLLGELVLDPGVRILDDGGPVHLLARRGGLGLDLGPDLVPTRSECLERLTQLRT